MSESRGQNHGHAKIALIFCPTCFNDLLYGNGYIHIERDILRMRLALTSVRPDSFLKFYGFEHQKNKENDIFFFCFMLLGVIMKLKLCSCPGFGRRIFSVFLFLLIFSVSERIKHISYTHPLCTFLVRGTFYFSLPLFCIH